MKDRILAFLTRYLRFDFLLHALIGYAIVAGSFMAAVMTGLAPTLQWRVIAVLVGYLFARAAAWFKEGYDETNPDRHTKDVMDAEMTRSGAALAAGMILIGLMVIHAP